MGGLCASRAENKENVKLLTMVRRNETQTTNILPGVAASAQKAWKATMSQMKGSMDRQTFNTLLGSAELLACEDGVYTIGMANGFTRDWAEQRLSETIEKILSGMAMPLTDGQTVMVIRSLVLMKERMRHLPLQRN